MSQGHKKLVDIVRKTEHSKNTIKKYLRDPVIQRAEHSWATRKNPFEDLWEEIKTMILTNPGLQAKTIFEYLNEKYPNKYSNGQLRSLQRHIKKLKALEGKNKTVFFEQQHEAGKLGAFDFTHMNDLDITINHQHFTHILFHFVLTFSNWEWARLCYAESFDSLRSGLKESFYRLGGTPKELLSDNLACAIHYDKEKNFKAKYADLLKFYDIKGRAIQPGCSNENGDIEQRHFRLKKAIDQALILRNSRNFNCIEEYQTFIFNILTKLNRSREKLVEEEITKIKPLPKTEIADYTPVKCRVTKYSTIRIYSCAYSVPSRLIGEFVEARVYDNKIEVWYAQKKIIECSRCKGKGKFFIDYRHVIESLIRKPGAFRQYRYKDDLFPGTVFRMAYDRLLEEQPLHADKIYLQLLSLSAATGRDVIGRSLKTVLEKHQGISLTCINEEVEKELKMPTNIQDVKIADINLQAYDELFEEAELC